MNRSNVIDYTHYEHLQFEIINSVATAIFLLPFGPAFFLICYPNNLILGFVLLIAFLAFSFILYKNRPKEESINDYTFRKVGNYKQLDDEIKSFEQKVDYFKKYGYFLMGLDIIGLPIVAAIVYFTAHPSFNLKAMDVILSIALIGAGILISIMYLNSQKLKVLRNIKTKLLS